MSNSSAMLSIELPPLHIHIVMCVVFATTEESMRPPIVQYDADNGSRRRNQRYRRRHRNRKQERHRFSSVPVVPEKHIAIRDNLHHISFRSHAAQQQGDSQIAKSSRTKLVPETHQQCKTMACGCICTHTHIVLDYDNVCNARTRKLANIVIVTTMTLTYQPPADKAMTQIGWQAIDQISNACTHRPRIGHQRHMYSGQSCQVYWVPIGKSHRQIRHDQTM